LSKKDKIKSGHSWKDVRRGPTLKLYKNKGSEQ